jgi:polysaccharide export outer membrane protein
MFALLQVVVLCAAADAAPGYTVHVRELTVPERVVRVPLTGSETVLDAVAALKRPPNNLARMDLWVARSGEGGKVQVLRIDWTEITMRGVTATNYQLLTGDRLFLQARPAK